MTKELKIENITLIGIFKPNLFDRYFFDKNDIINESDILEKSSFQGDIVQVITKKFALMMTEVHFSITADNDYLGDSGISDIILKIFDVFPLNVSGSGINFHWFLKTEDGNINSLSKDLFYNPNNKIVDEYFSDDINDNSYGFYASKNFLECRLKLDAHPIVYTENGKEPEKAILFDFNYRNNYNEISQQGSNILKVLENYKLYKEEAEKMIMHIC
ncbi:hypothetical protein, partial [Flavobacterium sp.]